MKKKLLAAAVLAAMTLSTSSVFASAPTISGDANIEYLKDSGADRQITNRIRLNVDNSIGDSLYIHGRVRLDNNMDTTSANGEAKISFDQAYIGGTVDTVNFRAGKQPLWLGKGLLADTDGSNGLKLGTNLENVKVSGFMGRDYNAGVGYNVSAADMNTSYGPVNFGASYLKRDDQKFWGINADTKLAENAVLNVEYVKNTNSSAKGYLAEVKFGNASKKGDMDYSVIYRNIEDGAVTGYTTNGNYPDSKGFKVKANYKVTDNSNLSVYFDAAKTQGTDAVKKRTDVEFSVNF